MMSSGSFVRRKAIGRAGVLVGTLALSLSLAACGDDDENEAGGPGAADLEENLCGAVTASDLGDIAGTDFDEYTYPEESVCQWDDDDPITGSVVIRLVSDLYSDRIEEQALNPNFDLEEAEIDGVTVMFVS